MTTNYNPEYDDFWVCHADGSRWYVDMAYEDGTYRIINIATGDVSYSELAIDEFSVFPAEGASDE